MHTKECHYATKKKTNSNELITQMNLRNHELQCWSWRKLGFISIAVLYHSIFLAHTD